jgi:hypothetical protein
MCSFAVAVLCVCFPWGTESTILRLCLKRMLTGSVLKSLDLIDVINCIALSGHSKVN